MHQGPDLIFGVTLVAQTIKNQPAIQKTQVRPQGQEDPLENEMAIHSSILAWEIPCTEEPGGLYSSWDGKESDMTELLTLSHIVFTTC